jgi:hypothetical protein
VEQFGIMARLRGVAGWRTAAAIAAIALYVVAVSNTAYELTSPLSLPHHVAFRKVYAVLAFTVVGFLFDRSEIPKVSGFFGMALLVGLYSYAIEIGQIVIDQSTETVFQHGFDVASGVLGGALGSSLARVVVLRSPISFRHMIFLAVMVAVIMVAFFPTYGSTG